jgi:Cu2+-exporting ATPase
MDKDQVLALAAAVEADSEHDIARSIVSLARERNLDLSDSSGFRALPGRGAEAEVGGNRVTVGGPRLLEALGIEPPKELGYSLDRSRQSGHTVVYLVQDDQVKGAIALADVIREEAREAVRMLKNENVRVAMITGDSRNVAQWVAAELKIDEFYAEVLPQDKAQKVQELQHRGKRVAMVGDGVNDAPALAAADVGIAIGAGTDVAIEAGGIVLVRNDPRDVARIILLSRATYAKMLQNLIWAAGYNVVAIPLAAGVLASSGVILPPAVAAILMSASTVIVALNSQLLRRLRLTDDAILRMRSPGRQHRPQRRQQNLRPAFPGHHGAS